MHDGERLPSQQSACVARYRAQRRRSSAHLFEHAASSGASAHGTAGQVGGPSSCTHDRIFARTTSGAASFPNVSQSERHAARSSALATSTSHFERSAVATHAARPFKTTRCRPSSAACAAAATRAATSADGSGPGGGFG